MDNVSQVDKVWSVLPAICAWIFVYSMPPNPRVLFVATLITIWALRLTFNACRRGFYVWPPWSGEEDYRWRHVRSTTFKNRPCLFVIFNFFFISAYQMCLIFLFTCPVILCHTKAPLSVLDLFAGAIMVTLIVLEFIADGQQQTFQNEKYRQIAKLGKPKFPYSLGFVHTGLWAYSRHPNFICEQLVWLTVYSFSAIAQGQWFNPSVIGPILLILLFVGSTNLTEELTASKYPEYKHYQQHVAVFIPLPWAKPY